MEVNPAKDIVDKMVDVLTGAEKKLGDQLKIFLGARATAVRSQYFTLLMPATVKRLRGMECSAPVSKIIVVIR